MRCPICNVDHTTPIRFNKHLQTHTRQQLADCIHEFMREKIIRTGIKSI